MTHIDHDLVIVHDPQPLPLIEHYQKHNKNKAWVWRCHIDLSKPDRELWKYLKIWINQYDEVIVSMESYKQEGIKPPQNIICPSIDPLSTKNKRFPEKKLLDKIKKEGINVKKPFIAQVSRFDKWKDPVGVIKAFNKVRENHDVQLVLLGNLASDDPEGSELYNKLCNLARGDKDIHIINKTDELLVNAVQTKASIIVQNSKKEGFGLTVTEALWKGTPVIATGVGGIKLQVIDGKTGYIIKNNHQLIKKLDLLLSDNKHRTVLGTNAREHVRKNFLLPKHMNDYLSLFERHLV